MLRRAPSLLATIGFAACMIAMPLAAQPVAGAERPSLVVVLVVDQMRPDYFTRWGEQLTGRFARGDSLAGRVAMKRLTDSLGVAISHRTHVDAHLEFEGGLLYADTVQLHAAGVKVDSLARAIATQLQMVPGIARVFSPGTLALAANGDVDARRWRHSIPPVTQWLVALVAKPGVALSEGGGAEHGTMHEESVTVPIAFMGAPFRVGVYDARARTVDIAPTLAQALGIRLPVDLYGQALIDVLRNETAHTAARDGFSKP